MFFVTCIVIRLCDVNQQNALLKLMFFVMHVKFKHGVVLDRNLKLLLLSYTGRDR